MRSIWSICGNDWSELHYDPAALRPDPVRSVGIPGVAPVPSLQGVQPCVMMVRDGEIWVLLKLVSVF